MSFICFCISFKRKYIQKFGNWLSIFSLIKWNEAKGDVCIFSDTKFVLRLEFRVWNQIFNSLHRFWKQSFECWLFEIFCEYTDSIDCILSEITHIWLWPKSNVGKLITNVIDKHLVCSFDALVYEFDEEIFRRGYFDFTYTCIIF